MGFDTLKLNLLLLWLPGYFPVRNPLIKKSDLKIHKKSFVYCFSVVQLILTATLHLHYCLRIVFSTGGVSRASRIIYSFTTVSIFLNDLSSRLVGIFYGDKICDVLQNLDIIDAYLEPLLKQAMGPPGSGSGAGDENKIVSSSKPPPLHRQENIDFVDAEDTIAEIQTPLKIKFKKDLISFKTKVYFLWVCSILTLFWTGVIVTWWYFERDHPIESSLYFLNLPHRWMTDSVELMSNIVAIASCTSTTGFAIALGIALIERYRKCCQILQMMYLYPKSNCWNWNNWSDEPRFEDSFIEAFTQLRKGFYSFNKVAGVYGLTNLFMMGMMLTYGIFALIWPNDGIANILNCTSSMLLVSLILGVGVSMKVEMLKQKENLSRLLIKEKLKKVGSRNKLGQITKWVIQWKWEFSGRNVCRINYELIPGMTCALMAYMTFLIQLELSENQRF